jgi:hypothetical protein
MKLTSTPAAAKTWDLKGHTLNVNNKLLKKIKIMFHCVIHTKSEEIQRNWSTYFQVQFTLDTMKGITAIILCNSKM